MGASVDFFCVTGEDEVAQYARDALGAYKFHFELLGDPSRPTTLKQRFRANNKTLLRVSHLRQHDISADLVDSLFERIMAAVEKADVLIFSDFNYGCLPQVLVDRLREACTKRGIMMVADSQASSQVSDVSRFQNMRLITPTEHEARMAMRDGHSGLAVLADALRHKANAEQVVITLASEGILIHAPASAATTTFATDRLPAFNTAPKDVTGAGDSFLTCASLALAAGADIWRSAYLGSIAAACQVGRIGNHPLSTADLIEELGL
jgi:rfaE bifunctional protein kinase chain/domain